MAAPALSSLLDHPLLWRGRQAEAPAAAGISTRHVPLDALLPGGGWPRGSLVELLSPVPGIGEMALLLPTLASFCSTPTTSRRLRGAMPPARIVLIDPPFLPYGPGLEQSGLHLDQIWWIRPDTGNDATWACEQSLRSGTCAAVLLWPRQPLADKALRRLQLAAEQGRSLGFLLQSAAQAPMTSPAAIRLEITRHETGLDLHMRKCRGLSDRPRLRVPLQA